MPKSRFIAWMFPLGLMVLGAGMVSGQAASTGSGQDYPNKPIRIVYPGGGGASDFTVRLIAQGISGALGQPVVIDDRPSGIIPGRIVSQAPPDGYTMLLAPSGIWINPLLQATPYDPVRDFSPITLATRAPNILVMHPSSPVQSVKELITLAKAKPGALNYASGPAASSPHLAAELFKAMAGVDIVRVSYKTSSIQMADLVGGRVEVSFGNAGTVMPYIKSSRLKALAVTTAEPSPVAPWLPTVAATVPGYEATAAIGMFVPAKTPATIISRLNQEIVRVIKQADIRARFLNAGAETVGSSPAQFAAVISSDMVKIGKLIKSAGIRAE